MGIFEAIKELCETDGELSDAASSLIESIFECGHNVADALDGLAEKLGEAEIALAGEDGEESCWAVDRLDPEWESTPKLMAMRTAVDSIVGFCEKASDVIDSLTDKIQDMTYN